MLRPGSLPRAGSHAAGPASSRAIVFPTQILLPSISAAEQAPCSNGALRCRDAGTIRSRTALLPTTCRAARRPLPDDDIEDMTVEQRLQRLAQLSGRVGEVRSVFDRESLLRQMGALDPALYATAIQEEGDEEEEDLPLEWIDWNDDPRTHVVNNTISEPLPDGLRRRLVLGRDAEEDEAIISVPLHNCLAVYICEGLEVDDSLERQEAAEDFANMQLAFLERWEQFHGPLPPALVDLLCDYSFDAPPARAKMALWVLWLAEGGCSSEYWREALGSLPQPEDMPNAEFCTDEELQELQWLPYALPISVRREALRSFYEYFGASPLAEALGFQRSSDVDPLDPEGTAAAAAAAAAGDAAVAGPSEPLRPLPPFKRFLWAYCHAEAHSLGNGERVVFFPQADPSLYATEPTHINTTLAVVADDGPMMDEFAVVATLRPLERGVRLQTHAPFGEGVSGGGGGSTSQLHTQFGMVPDLGGNQADLQDLDPETGSIADDWLKRLLGQEAATRLDMVTDPRLRHLLTLAETGDADMNQMPPLRRILPPLQLPKLWGPGLIAGVKRLRLDERWIEPSDMEREAVEGSMAEEAREAEAMAAERRAAGFATGSGDSGDGESGVSYDEYEAWKEDLRSQEIVEIPGDPKILETDEGCAEWRRMKAAWASLPRVSPSNKEHGRCMELALQGAPLEQVFSSPREITRELAAAEALLAALNRVLASLPTSIEHDEQLIANAAAASASATQPTSARGKDAAAGGRRSSGKRRSSGASSGSGSESDAEAAADAPPPPLTAIVTPRMLGVVAWRLELKRVWRQMAGMVQEYRDGLAVAEAAAAAGAGEPLAV